MTFFYNQGIPVKIDAQHAIAHNKVMITDGETVIIGSFNFTKKREGAYSWAIEEDGSRTEETKKRGMTLLKPLVMIHLLSG